MSLSLKLINYATDDSGYIKLYTELTHNFQIGDIVYIIGGYYDNTKSLAYSTLNFSQLNTTGYKILAIDLDTNSFTIDRASSVIYYPYGVSGNPYGDPTNTTNKAYNTTTDKYNDVFVSTVAFQHGTITSGSINNGIIGIDNVLNNSGGILTDKVITIGRSNTITYITHIVSKNTKLNKVTTTDKTNTLASCKKTVLTDLGLSSSITYETLGLNNDGYGYSYYEQVRNNDFDITINSGMFTNGKESNIILQKNTALLSFNNVMLGNEIIEDNGCIINTTDVIDSSFIRNITSNYLLLDDTEYNTFMEFTNVTNITPISETFNLKLKVDYNELYLTNLFIGQTVLLRGILFDNRTNLDYSMSEVTANIVSYGITYGDINSAYIEITSSEIIDALNDALDITVSSTIKLAYTTKHKIPTLRFNQNNIFSGYLNDEDIYFKDNNIIKEGYLNQITMNDSTSLLGTSNINNVCVINVKQLNTSDTILSNFNYVFVNGDTTLKGNFNNSTIVKATIHNSIINGGTRVYSSYYPIGLFAFIITGIVYLHKCIIEENSYTSTEVYWDFIRINFSGTNPNSVFGERHTPFITHEINSDISNDYALNLNIVRQQYAKNSYNDFIPGEELKSMLKSTTTEINLIPSTTTKYVVPLLNYMYNNTNPINYGDFYTIIDNGSLENNGNWFSVNYELITPIIKDRVLFANTLNNNTTLQNKIIDRLDNIGTGGTTEFPGSAFYDSWVYTDSNSIYPENVSAIEREININIFKQYPDYDRTDNFLAHADLTPDYTKTKAWVSGNILNLFKLEIQQPSGIPVYASNGDTLGLRIGSSVVKLWVDKTANNWRQLDNTNVSLIPSCFIEIERITSDGNYIIPTDDKKIVNTSYTGTSLNKRSWNNLVNFSSLAQTTEISTEVITTSSGFYTYTVEFWITWYAGTYGVAFTPGFFSDNFIRNAGHRTKHTFTCTLGYDTFNIIDDLNNSLIDDLGNNIIWG